MADFLPRDAAADRRASGGFRWLPLGFGKVQRGPLGECLGGPRLGHGRPLDANGRRAANLRRPEGHADDRKT